MSTFDLLADEDLLYQQVKKPQRNKKKVQPKQIQIVTETEFTKIHLHEIWVVTLKYLDFKSLYTSLLFVDKKISEILLTLEFQKFVIGREFADVISGEYELDHAALYTAKMNIQKGLEKILERNDPLNRFEFRKKLSHSKPKVEIPDIPQQQIFKNLYFGLLNRRTETFNRNMKLRKLIRARAISGWYDLDEYDTHKRGKMKFFKGAQESGYGMVTTEINTDIENEQRRRMECEHFKVNVKKSSDPKYPYILCCKICNAEERPFLNTVREAVQKFL